MASRAQVRAGVARSVVIAAWVACAPGPAATDSTPARHRNCVFEVLRASPGPAYVEVARIALEGDADYGAGKYRNTQTSANVLREVVCEVGGDAIQTEVDGRGVVVRVIVFRRASAAADRR